jgi:2-oxoisovalerate dehydrogenase E2 component (dihydrolipoyl transacylase)
MRIFNLPDLGEGLAEAEIREWFVNEGDEVKVDQPLLSMETAKAVVDVPSPHAGRISKLYGKNGDMIQTHEPLVGFDSEEQVVRKDKGTVVGNLEESENVLDEGDVIIGTHQKTMNSVKVMPAVRSLAKQLQVDLNAVKATGPNGQITADDVKKHGGDVTTMSGKVLPLRGVRHFMALAMAESHKQIVAVTISDDADITDLPGDTDFTVYMMEAIVEGVKAEPAMNAWFDGKKMERILHDQVNLGLAIDTEEGLFVPVIKGIEKKSSNELRTEINKFKSAAKDRSLAPEDFQSGTITFSNFGVFAGQYATLIVVPPMVAIVGCGRIREIVGVNKGNIEIRRIVPLSLSFDHRAITGGEATRFLAAIIRHLQKK